MVDDLSSDGSDTSEEAVRPVDDSDDEHDMVVLKQMYPEASEVDLRKAMADLRGAKRDSSCDCQSCQREGERLSIVRLVSDQTSLTRADLHDKSLSELKALKRQLM